MKFKGIWHVVHRDVEGNIKTEEIVENLITLEGRNYLLNSGAHGAAQVSNWYFAPWSTNTTPAAAHNYATPVNTEATNYTEATRQEWTEGTSASGSLTNATAATITADTGGVTIYGAGIVGGGSAPTTKGDAAGGGTLLASALFSASKPLSEGETLDFTYTLSATSS